MDLFRHMGISLVSNLQLHANVEQFVVPEHWITWRKTASWDDM